MSNIPILYAWGNNIPEAWEDSLIKLYEEGCEISTQYDQENDLPSRDCTMVIEIVDPLSEPMIHKDMPGGYEDLQEYTMEVLDGIKDHLIRDPNDPNDTKWEYCVSPETLILLPDYSQKKIKQCHVGDDVLCWNGQKLITTTILDKVTSYSKPITFSFIESNNITCSQKHPLFVMGKGWTTANNIKLGDFVAVSYGNNNVKLPHINLHDCCNIITETDIQSIPYNFNKARIIKELKAKNLLPFRFNNEFASEIVCLCGYLFGDGWLSTPNNDGRKYDRGKVGFAGEYTALLRIRNIIEKIGFSCESIRVINQKCTINNRLVKGQSLTFNCGHSALWALFYCLGVPIGSKSTQKISVPDWVYNNGLDIKTLFLTGFFDAEISAVSKKGIGVGTSFYFRQNNINYHNLKYFINSISNLLSDLGIHTYFLPDYTKGETFSLGLRIGDRESVDKFLTTFYLPFSFTKQIRNNLYIKYRNYCYNLMEKLDIQNLSHARAMSVKDFLGVDINKYSIYDQVTTVSIDNIDLQLYDIAVENKEHNFIGNGVICHNTYHDRLTNYNDIDQLYHMCEQLADCGYTRRGQCITWKPSDDLLCDDPPCLQSIWCRIIDNTLNMNVRMRSNDAYKANMMNMYSFVRLQEKIAQEVSRMSKTQVSVGRYCHFADSYHIYGKDLREFENRFLQMLKNRTFDERTAKYEEVKEIMEEAIPNILQKINNAKTNSLGK